MVLAKLVFLEDVTDREGFPDKLFPQISHLAKKKKEFKSYFN